MDNIKSQKIQKEKFRKTVQDTQTEVECTCSAMQCILQVHCSLCKWQCTCSVRAAYTAATLPVHSTSVWVIKVTSAL